MKRREQWYLIISILILSLSRNSKKMKIYLKPRKSTFFFFFIAFHLSPCFSEEPLREFKDCGVSYNCGELVNITYPFWGNKRQSFCGRKEFKLNCSRITAQTMKSKWRVWISICSRMLPTIRTFRYGTIARGKTKFKFRRFTNLGAVGNGHRLGGRIMHSNRRRRFGVYKWGNVE